MTQLAPGAWVRIMDPISFYHYRIGQVREVGLNNVATVAFRGATGEITCAVAGRYLWQVGGAE
jgi:hypothetical protein